VSTLEQVPAKRLAHDPVGVHLSGRFPLFDSLRAIAALSIVAYHANATGMVHVPRAVAEYTSKMAVGVTLFFVISAFLLYRPFARAHILGGSTSSLGSYAWRRILRIVPAYWVALTVISVIGQDQENFGPNGLLYFGFAQIYSTRHVLGGIGVAWSLAVEMTLYMFLPLWAYVISRIPRETSSERMRVQLFGLAALAAASILFKALWVFTPTPVFTDAATLGTSILTYLDIFAAGMAVAVVSVWFEGRPLPRALRPLDRFPGSAWLVAASAFWILATQIGLPATGWAHRTVAQRWTMHELSAVMGVAMVLPLVFGDQHRGWLRSFLAQRWLLWMGAVSYGIYLWHLFVFDELKRTGILPPTWSGVVPYLALFAIAVAVATAIAALSFRFVESPAMALRGRNPFRSVTASPFPSSLTAVIAVSSGVLIIVALLGTAYVVIDVFLAVTGALLLASALLRSRWRPASVPISTLVVTGLVAAALAFSGLLLPAPGRATVEAVPTTHVVATVEGPVLRLFVNGKQVTWLWGNAAPRSASGPLVIGGAEGGQGWDGVVDEVALYRERLTPDAIEAHYLLGTGAGGDYAKGIQQTPGLAAYWRLGELGPAPAVNSVAGSPAGRYVGGTRNGVAGLLTASPNRAARFGGDTSRVDVHRRIRLGRQYSVEAWVSGAPEMKDRLILSGPNRFSLGLDPLGRWTFVTDTAARPVTLTNHTRAAPIDRGHPPGGPLLTALAAGVLIALSTLLWRRGRWPSRETAPAGRTAR